MTELTPDPELDRMVRELNRLQERRSGETGPEEPHAPRESAVRSEPSPAPEPGEVAPRLDHPALAVVEEGADLERLLGRMVRRGASDLHLVAGLPPVVRIDDRLVRLDDDALDGDEIARLFRPHLGERSNEALARRGAADFTLRLAPGRGVEGSVDGSAGQSGAKGWRFRVNLHRQRGALAAAIRALPREIPTLAGLHLPPSLAELVEPRRGLVLVCGPTGAGKSSTLAALVGEINRKRSLHVITIEDPVEYEHPSASSVVEQIEIGRDARSFAEALRAALRQDPDVILVGEMRDLETVRIALTAAETGHLVLSTLHTSDSAQAIHRMIDVFPGDQQAQIRHQLALSLHAVVTQQLVPRAAGPGRVPSVEVLRATHPVRHLIRNDQLQKLPNEITLGKRAGMISMEESLSRLIADGAIDLEEAKIRTPRQQELDSLLGGAGL